MMNKVLPGCFSLMSLLCFEKQKWHDAIMVRQNLLLLTDLNMEVSKRSVSRRNICSMGSGSDTM